MNNSNAIYQMFNALGIATAYFMLALSVWLAPVDLSTKGYWGMGIFLLTLALVNFVKYRIEDRLQSERIYKLEAAKNEKIIQDYITAPPSDVQAEPAMAPLCSLQSAP